MEPKLLGGELNAFKFLNEGSGGIVLRKGAQRDKAFDGTTSDLLFEKGGDARFEAQPFTGEPNGGIKLFTIDG